MKVEASQHRHEHIVTPASYGWRLSPQPIHTFSTVDAQHLSFSPRVSAVWEAELLCAAPVNNRMAAFDELAPFEVVSRGTIHASETVKTKFVEWRISKTLVEAVKEAARAFAVSQTGSEKANLFDSAAFGAVSLIMASLTPLQDKAAKAAGLRPRHAELLT